MKFDVQVMLYIDKICLGEWSFVPRIGEHIQLLENAFRVVDVIYEIKDGTYKNQPIIVTVVPK